MSSIVDLMKYELVYLGTPYSKYEAGIEQAFIDACKLAAVLLRAGVRVYSPIAHTHPIAIHGGIDPLDHRIWLPFDAAIMRKSDAMVVGCLDGWAESEGVIHEMAEFLAMNKPRYLLNPKTLGVTTIYMEPGSWGDVKQSVSAAGR